MRQGPKLYTIGYEKALQQNVLSTLIDAGVAICLLLRPKRTRSGHFDDGSHRATARTAPRIILTQ